MAKKISIPKPTSADAFVAQGLPKRPPNPEAAKTYEKKKRLTIDVPSDLHKRIKTACAIEGIIMADRLREILEKEFPGK